MYKISEYLKHSALIYLSAFAFMLISVITLSAETINYTYDDMSRLIKVEHDDGTVIEYVYDNMGNRMQKGTYPNGVPSNNPPYAATLVSPADDATGVYLTKLQVSNA
jgi:YD repeat-containing protein